VLKIIAASVLDVAAFALPALLLAAMITYTAWAWCMDIAPVG
jgi:hypothetical protein